ncbi:MAG: YfiR family protein [Candidatus Saccharimonas sp.]|nr:YfiR family protein [Planctomycetaceae bacterium]
MLSLLAIGGGTGVAQQGVVIDREYELKAAYLYQFARYVEWPKNAVPGDDTTFVIGVLGQDPFGIHLDRIAAAKTIQGRKIVVRRFASAKDYQPCHILFVASGSTGAGDEKSAAERLTAALAATAGSHVLLVSDSANFAHKGAVINFHVDPQQNRITLEINRDSERRAGLKISSQLLGLEKSGVVKIVSDN